MKKILLSSAACATFVVSLGMSGAVQASDLDMSISGKFITYGAYNNQDEPAGVSFRSFDLRKETELIFRGETLLDNGLTVGAVFVANTDRNESVSKFSDKSYVYFSGGWGKISAGELDGVNYSMQVAAPSADKNIDGLRQQINTFDLGQLLGANTGVANDRFDYDHSVSGKRTKIMYFTPNYDGFQAGISYMPSFSEGEQDSLAGITTNNDANDYDDGIEISAR